MNNSEGSYRMCRGTESVAAPGQVDSGSCNKAGGSGPSAQDWLPEGDSGSYWVLVRDSSASLTLMEEGLSRCHAGHGERVRREREC
ncbi:hypothetical protein E2C01_081907 [Portunus trituberculatus]|uniref:Uncharacterized protein n=1 Tax=Portunus trituberculatus TaxID=210409 RepID=A0A5B7J2C9_PORTR|nr:hypothetical protein [Portunus trituberculatus]